MNEELRYFTPAGFFSKCIMDAKQFDNEDDAYIFSMVSESLKNHYFIIMKVYKQNEIQNQ